MKNVFPEKNWVLGFNIDIWTKDDFSYLVTEIAKLLLGLWYEGDGITELSGDPVKDFSRSACIAWSAL